MIQSTVQIMQGSMNIQDVPGDELSDSELVLINNISAVSLFRDVLFTRLFRTPRNTSILTGAQKTIEFLEGHPVRFYEQFRLEKHTFYLLRDALCERKLLKDTNRMTVDEQLLMFLHTIGHNVRNRVIQDRYQHSGEPISRHFNKVLDAINGLRDVCITIQAIESHPKYWVTQGSTHISRYNFYLKNILLLHMIFISTMSTTCEHPYLTKKNPTRTAQEQLTGHTLKQKSGLISKLLTEIDMVIRLKM